MSQSLFRRISQIGIIVPDIQSTTANIRRVFGVEPSIEGHILDRNLSYFGQPAEFDALLALFDFDDVQLEFLQPLSGRTIWQDHVDAHGYGIHHIRFDCDDEQAGIETMQSQGMPVSQAGDSRTPNMRWTCFDSEPVLGFVLEMMTRRKEE